jgi:hypothetical protein
MELRDLAVLWRVSCSPFRNVPGDNGANKQAQEVRCAAAEISRSFNGGLSANSQINAHPEALFMQKEHVSYHLHHDAFARRRANSINDTGS